MTHVNRILGLTEIALNNDAQPGPNNILTHLSAGNVVDSYRLSTRPTAA